MLTMSSLFVGLRQFFLLPVLLGAHLLVHAGESGVLFQGGLVAITVQDVLAELGEIPADRREKLFSDSKNIGALVENIYLRKTLAIQSKSSGSAEKEEVKTQLVIAQERILAEAELDFVESASLPKMEAIDKQIRSIYKAESERFTNPAEVHVRHILIAGEDDAARIKAEKILFDLRAGADFEQLAREHSTDPGSAAKGGDLGFFPKGKMVPTFEKAAFALNKTGDLSPVVKTAFGFHIIRLEGRKPATIQPFDTVKDQLRIETITKLKKDIRRKEIERLRAQAQGDAIALEAFIAEQKILLDKERTAQPAIAAQ